MQLTLVPSPIIPIALWLKTGEKDNAQRLQVKPVRAHASMLSIKTRRKKNKLDLQDEEHLDPLGSQNEQITL